MLHNDPYILNLEKEKKELQSRIDELRRNIITIDGLILKRKSQLLAEVVGEHMTIKNTNKLFYEALIIDIISKRNNGIRTAEIFREIKNRGYKINYNTLRAYIVSMNLKKKITKSKRFIYNWITPEKAE